MSGNPEGAETYAMPDERRYLTEHQAILICMLAGISCRYRQLDPEVRQVPEAEQTF